MEKKISLQNMPDDLKNWKSLSEYNKQWYFISGNIRYVIAEHIAAVNYFHSLFNWLEPSLVFGDVHKRMVLILIASIYESVLTNAVNRTRKKEYYGTNILRSYLSKKKILNEYDYKFEVLINDCFSARYYNNDWKKYLHNIREVRNWIHIAKERNDNLKQWFDGETIESLKDKLEDFRRLSEEYFNRNQI